ncbi:protein LEAD-SENSITIVE 1-like [Rutidosis leptorrhynchoides]|uniref:protein LEAD-SENSITIVE 1-like n=1 Tax=Rutidosis leptorrhynchoides TaxID=125765 RepID=UPI003A98E79F
MDLFSQTIKRSELKEGDHIYTWRKQLYSHHGIFIGENKIIHFVNTKREGDQGSRFGLESRSNQKKPKTPCPTSYCGLEKVAGSGVKLCCVDCFIKGGSLYLFKYQASRKFLLSKTVGGTCTMAESDPVKEVIHRTSYLYENGYGKYDLMNNNCEDFALYCKTGLWSVDKAYQGRSSQANMVRPTSRAQKDQKIAEYVQQIATAIPRSFSKREVNDLGFRKDVVKVPVEELCTFVLSLMQC